ncbi:MAG: DUF1802 family protein [bacterium]|nr:DUF1802 family protein [bacterium]
MNKVVNIALKEWSVVINILKSTNIAVIARKGGLLDKKEFFDLKSNFFTLFPTYEHQAPEKIRQEFRNYFTNETSNQLVKINTAAKVVDSYVAYSLNDVENFFTLQPFSYKELENRFFRYGKKFLNFLLLRVYTIDENLIDTKPYAGCISWVELKENININNLKPVIPDEKFEVLKMLFNEAKCRSLKT